MTDMQVTGAERKRRYAKRVFRPDVALFANNEAGAWYDASDLTPEKISWRRNLLTWSQQFDNSAWFKSNASIQSNLLLWSQDFDNAAWTKTEGTVTANTATAPDSTNTADLFVPSVVSSSIHRITVVATTTGTDTFSIYAKANGYSWIKFRFASGWVNFNVSNGTVGFSSGVTSPTITSVGNGWYRCAFIYSGATSNTLYVTVDTSDTNSISSDTFAGDGTSGVLLWGAQLVAGTSAGTYAPTTSATAPIVYTAPDGTATAQLEIGTGGTFRLDRADINTRLATPYVISVYVKQGTSPTVAIDLLNTAFGPVFTFATNSWSVVSGWTTGFESVGNGWIRLWASCISNSVTGGPGFTVSGTTTVQIWGAQFEIGTVPSSYQRITDFTSDFLAAFPQHALYQDSAGTTPVTALGQPVGLVLDKSKGGLASLGSELVTNGGPAFTTTTGWTARANCTIAATGGNIVGTSTNTSAMRFYTTAAVTAGRTYRVIANIAAVTGTSPGVYIFSDVGITQIQQQLTPTSGVYTFYVTATTATLYFDCGNVVNTGAGQTYAVASLTVREVPGSHAIQATSASRPTCDARVNLLTYSEQFDNAVWSVARCSITANTSVAPDGTTTADTLVEDTTSNSHPVYRTIAGLSATTYTTSVYIKASGRNKARVAFANTAFGGSPYVDFDLVAVTATGASGGTGTITDTGNGWYRCTATATATAGSGDIYIQPRDAAGNASYTGSGAAALLLWGADLRLASDAVYPYQRVVTASDYADVQSPRYLTFDGVDDSLYTASSVDFATWTSTTRRNLLTYPSAFDNSAWAKNASTVTANAAVAPDGTTTADTVTASAGAAFHYINRTSPLTLTGTHTYSFYVRKNTATWIFFTVNDSAINYFNLDTGQFGTTIDACSVTVEGNGWYRISVVRTLSAALANCGIGIAGSNGGANFTAAGTESIYVWGAQLELGTTATAFQDVGTDKVSVFTGVRKLSDATKNAVVAEFGVRSATGSFGLYAPSFADGTYSFASQGTGVVEAIIGSSYLAPITNVLTGLADIASDICIVRANGTPSTLTTDQGAGTYSTYVLFIGRRNNATLPFNGRIYQMIVRGASTDTATVSRTEQWVAGKTGVTL